MINPVEFLSASSPEEFEMLLTLRVGNDLAARHDALEFLTWVCFQNGDGTQFEERVWQYPTKTQKELHNLQLFCVITTCGFLWYSQKSCKRVDPPLYFGDEFGTSPSGTQLIQTLAGLPKRIDGLLDLWGCTNLTSLKDCLHCQVDEVLLKNCGLARLSNIEIRKPLTVRVIIRD